MRCFPCIWRPCFLHYHDSPVSALNKDKDNWTRREHRKIYAMGQNRSSAEAYPGISSFEFSQSQPFCRLKWMLLHETPSDSCQTFRRLPQKVTCHRRFTLLLPPVFSVAVKDFASRETIRATRKNVDVESAVKVDGTKL